MIDSVRSGALVAAALLLAGCSSPMGFGYTPVFPERHTAPAWSPKGKIAYVDFGVTCVEPEGGYFKDPSKAGVWIYDVSSGTRSRFLSAGDFPAWDPSGELLTVTWGRTSLRTYGLDGQLRWEMPVSGLAVRPSWSRDGQYIVWDQTLDDAGIWVAQRDSLVPRRIRPYPGYVIWNPTKLAILYGMGDGRGTRTTFYEYDLLRGTVETLFSLGGNCTSPCYSPDGSHIVFTGNNLFTAERLFPSQARGIVAWSPINLYSCTNTGTSLIQLTDTGGDEAAFEPNGARLAYIRLDPWSLDPAKNNLWIDRVSSGATVELVPAWPASCGN